MEKVLLGGGFILALGLVFAFSLRPAGAPDAAAPSKAETAVKWLSWEEAVAANEKQPKKLFVDIYTDWCGWCKRMDATTFKDEKVVGYLNEHFHAVKLDAEQKEDIEFDGHTFKFIKGGRNGVHELAYSLLDGRLGFPSFVFLDENFRRISISPGFKTSDVMLKELKYVGEEEYLKGD
jgi:thioredoxin-related protein